MTFRPLGFAALASILLGNVALADFTLSVTDLSATTIAPGDSFTFSIRLTDADNLAAFQVPIFLEGSTGTPGVDFDFSPVPTQPASGYVFGAVTGNFSALVDTSIGGFPQRERLTIADFLSSGSVDTAAGTDLIAEVTVTTSASFSGTLRLFFDASGIEILDPDLNDLPGMASPTSLTNAIQVTVRAVPEPAGLAFVGAALMISCAFLKRRRSR